jgi:heme o synthase
MSGLFYLAVTIVLDAVFLYYAVALYVRRTDQLAIKTFVYSLVYLMGLFAALLIDHYLPILARII